MSSAKLYDVLIVGCGPVGATLANLLGQRGFSVAVADIHREVYDKPRDINLDQEALRTLQTIGLVDPIIEGCEPHPGTDFLGADGELIKYIYSAPPPYPQGWPANLMFVQPHAEKILREGLARFDSVDLMFGYEATALMPSADYVDVTFKTDEGERTSVRAKYVVACDGANSPVRTWLGLGQEDLGFSEWWLVVDAWLKNEQPLPKRATQYCFPEAPSSYIVCSGKLRRWEMKILPEGDPQNYASLDRIKNRMVRFVDPEALEFWRSAVYHFHARVADEWQKGRVLLAGDAAHQMPPFLGQGLCAGFRDAVNLVWKLAMVLNGTAAPGLLATYTLERKPHIRTLTAITVGLGKIIGETDPARAAARDKELREEMNSGNVETVRQNLIPPLDRGLVYCDPNGKKGEGAGTLAVQPLIEQASGAVLLDQLTGPNFAILSPAPLPEAWMNSRLAQDWLKRGGRVAAIGPAASALKESGHLFADWIAELKTYAVIVRPDRYVYGVAHDAEELDRLMQSLFKQLDPA